jgi:hypothetical protein
LGGQLIALGENCRIRVILFTRQKVHRTFAPDSRGTKHGIAGILAERFPEELGFRLPPKRRPWMSEDYRMAIFDAVALGLTYFLPKQNEPPFPTIPCAPNYSE